MLIERHSESGIVLTNWYWKQIYNTLFLKKKFAQMVLVMLINVRCESISVVNFKSIDSHII